MNSSNPRSEAGHRINTGSQAEQMAGSGGNRSSQGSRRASMYVCLIAVAGLLGGCSSPPAKSAQVETGETPVQQSEARRDATATANASQPADPDESPEAALVRLSSQWDEAFAKHDENLLRQVFHPSYTGLDEEIANMYSPANKGTPTPVSEIAIESQAADRVILTAVFGYDEGPVRQRILLVGAGATRRIAGVQDVEG